jgi:hypothetical protein
MDKKQAWQAETWQELQELVDLETVRKALLAKEKQREYHKTAYLTRSAILAEAKRRGITA